MKNKIHYLLFLLFGALTSCSSSDNDNTNGNPTNKSYWPHAIGNTWHYKNVDLLEDTYVHHFYKTINYDGKTYFQVEPLNASENFELTGGTREDNGVFYELHGATSQMGINTSAGTIKSINTNLNVGETWTDEVTLNVSGAATGTIKHLNEGKIFEKADNVNINGKNYQNVLKVLLTKTVFNSLTGSSFTIKYEDWLAKGIGPIYRKTIYIYEDNEEEFDQYNLINYSLK